MSALRFIAFPLLSTSAVLDDGSSLSSQHIYKPIDWGLCSVRPPLLEFVSAIEFDSGSVY